MTSTSSLYNTPPLSSAHSPPSSTPLLSSPSSSPLSDHVPLSAHNQNTTPMASLKRKLTLRDDMHSSAKKHRPSVPSVTITLKPTKQKPFASAPIPMPNACPDYPNGFIYCHQCSKKRDVTDAIQCTFLEIPHTTTTTTTKDKDKDEKKENDDTKDKQKQKDKDKPPRLRRCVAKFCKFCLINRYDHEFDDVVNAARAKKKEQGHVDTAGYIYKCPKCSETCNCPRCRKSKGLEPMGSAGTIRKPPPEPVPKPSAAEKKKLKAAAAKQKSKESSSKAKATAAKKPKPKPPLPIPPKWTPVLTNISLDDAEARFHIREFVLRFVDLMEPTLPKTNLEELEEIGGGRRHQGRDEGEEMVSWVSEFCVKSIIVGLLNLVAKELHGALAAVIKSAVKEIRNLGVNLNKIWPVLASLRDDVSFLADHSSNNHNHNNNNNDSVVLLLQQDNNNNNNNNNPRPSTLPGSSSPRRPFIFTFPDPLPPPTTHDTTRIRSSTRLNNNDNNNEQQQQQQRIHIAYSAQMVPVISALIEDALLTAAVREEIEVGVREGKETVRDQREAVKREAERWEQVRKRMETRVKLKAQILENRAKREYHKQKLISLENSLKILSPKFSPRFAPVGVDMEERVYWIIPPGVSEREAAQDFIRSCASDEKLLSYNKKGGHHQRRSILKKAKVLGSEERQEMRSWSWFVAVWGKKPVESQKRREGEGVKLKIKVNAQRNGSDVKAKRRSESLEEDMEVDIVEELLDQQDEDEDMASVSDQEGENRDRSDSSPSSSSGSSQSDSDGEGEGEESDGTAGAKPASDETGSSSDDEEEEQQQQTEEEQDEEQDEEEEDNDRERWWGFYDPLEILKLSEWIAIKAGLEDESNNDPMSVTPLVPQDDDHSSRASSSSAAVTPNGTATPTINGSTTNGYTNGIASTEQKSRDTSVTLVANYNSSSSSSSSRPRPPLLGGGKAHLKNLVDELRTFATLLEWRCREDKYELILRDLAAAAGGSSSVSVNGSVNGDGGGSGVVVKGQKERESTTDGGRSISVSSFYGTR